MSRLTVALAACLLACGPLAGAAPAPADPTLTYYFYHGRDEGSERLGTPTRRIIVKNLLPQMVSVIMLRMALAIPGAIGSEVFLAYIGLGLPINIPSLGNLVNKGRSLMMAPSLRYQLFIPAIILSVITICFYLVGNAFADAADPKNHV